MLTQRLVRTLLYVQYSNLPLMHTQYKTYIAGHISDSSVSEGKMTVSQDSFGSNFFIDSNSFKFYNENRLFHQIKENQYKFNTFTISPHLFLQL